MLTHLLSHVPLCPVDSSIAWLTEVVLLGSSDARLADLSLDEETKTLLELTLGSSRGPAGGLWRKMEEYANSKGIFLYVCTCCDDDGSITHHRFIIEFCCVKAEWESGGSAGDCLLQTVCRCSLAALLKHTGLHNEACWQDRSVTWIY